MDRVLVVGAGLAGLQTVVALRAQGYAGALTLLGAETVPPYDRPPLSKAVMAGEADDTTLDADWAALDVTRLLGSAGHRVAGGGRARDRCGRARLRRSGDRDRCVPGAAARRRAPR